MNDRQQDELLDLLLAHKGPVLLSGYDNELYNDRLRGWYREEITPQNMAAAKPREILWMNFEPQRQMTLMNYEKEGTYKKAPEGAVVANSGNRTHI